MSKKNLKAIVIGAGRIALSHIPHIIYHQNFELIAIVEPSRLMRFVLGRLLKVKTYPSVKSIEGLVYDVAFVLTPPGSHYGIAKSLLKAKKDVFLEKPVTLDASNSKELLSLAKQNKVQLSCGYVYRHHPIYKEMQDLVAREVYGKPTSCKIQMIGNVIKADAPKTWRNVGKGAGCLYDYGCHAIDLGLFLFGAPTLVRCISKEEVYQEDVIDRFSAEMFHDNEFSVRTEIVCDWANSKVRKASLTVEVKTPRHVISTDGQAIRVTGELARRYSIKDLDTDVDYYLRGEEFQNQLVSFYHSIFKHDHDYLDAEDAVLCDAILSDLYEMTI